MYDLILPKQKTDSLHLNYQHFLVHNFDIYYLKKMKPALFLYHYYKIIFKNYLKNETTNISKLFLYVYTYRQTKKKICNISKKIVERSTICFNIRLNKLCI